LRICGADTLFEALTVVKSLKALTTGVRERREASGRTELGGERTNQIMSSISKVSELRIRVMRGYRPTRGPIETQ
jgi:hypothetical protein